MARIRISMAAVAGYGLLNAILYAALTPLWEGFDEPFHYACVQDFSTGRGLPRAAEAKLSEEVWRSLELAPVSVAVQANLPSLTSFEQYRALPVTEQARRHAELEALDPAVRFRDSAQPNYGPDLGVAGSDSHFRPSTFCGDRGKLRKEWRASG